MASVVCWALLLIASSITNAQTVDPTTGNLINFSGTPTATTSNWNNVGHFGGSLTCWAPGQPGYCGPLPYVNANSYGAINFSYGQTNLNQIVDINKALVAGGSGVQLSGFNFSFRAKNGNGWDNGQQDYLDAYVKFYNAAGGVAATYDYGQYTNRKYNWTNFNFSETFANPVAASNYSVAQVGFIGRDTNGWAGPYGPEVTAVSFNLKYRVDPCTTNPAYAPTCAGFDKVITSNNVLPTTDTWSQTLYQAAAVNTALQNAGFGAQVHGMSYSFNWQVGNPQCTDWFIICWSTANSNLGVDVRMTANNGSVLLDRTYVYANQNTNGSVQDKMLLPTSLNQTALGNVSMQSWGWGDSSAGNFKISLIYTPDPCSANPLYSTTCTGYGAAFAKSLVSSAPVASVSTTSAVSSTDTSTTPAAVAPTSSASSTTSSTVAAAAPTTSTTDSGTQQSAAASQSSPAASAPVTSAAPSATNPQPKPGDVQVAGSTKPSSPSDSKNGPSALAMSVVAKEQSKVNATAAAAVAQANDAAASATAQALDTAQSVAGSAQAQSISASVAIATSNTSSTTSKTTSSSSTSVITLQANTQNSVASVSNQRGANKSSTTDVATSNSQSSGSADIVLKSNNTASSQVATTATQQTSAQTLPPAPKQQETSQSSVQQIETASLPITPKQQSQVVQTTIQSAQVAVALPTAPKQQSQNSQMQEQQTQTATLPPQPQRQQGVVQAAVQQAIVVVAPPQAPKQNQETSQIQTTTTAVAQQQSVQTTQPQPQVIQYTPPPQAPSQPEPSIDYSIFVQTNLDSMKKGNINIQAEPEVPKVETTRVGARSILNDYINAQAFMALQGIEQTQDGMIKRNVQPNEAANGVDIASIAIQPKGFDFYSQLSLQDAQFYKTEEIYKNQKTVDNERVLRGLVRGSDRLHQEMVDLQYIE